MIPHKTMPLRDFLAFKLPTKSSEFIPIKDTSLFSKNLPCEVNAETLTKRANLVAYTTTSTPAETLLPNKKIFLRVTVCSNNLLSVLKAQFGILKAWFGIFRGWVHVRSNWGNWPEGQGSFRSKMPKFWKFCVDKNGGVAGKFGIKHLWVLSGVLGLGRRLAWSDICLDREAKRFAEVPSWESTFPLSVPHTWARCLAAIHRDGSQSELEMPSIHATSPETHHWLDYYSKDYSQRRNPPLVSYPSVVVCLLILVVVSCGVWKLTAELAPQRLVHFGREHL